MKKLGFRISCIIRENFRELEVIKLGGKIPNEAIHTFSNTEESDNISTSLFIVKTEESLIFSYILRDLDQFVH